MNNGDVEYFNDKFDRFKESFNELSNKTDKINEVLIEERTENKVRWEEHANRSELRTQQFNQTITDLKAEDKLQNEKIHVLPCGKHSEAMKSIVDKIKTSNDNFKTHIRVIYLIIGIAATTFGGLVLKVLATTPK